MKRGKPADVLADNDSINQRCSALSVEGGQYPGEDGDANDLEPPIGDGEIEHERARWLIRQQTQRLLPASDANALADHLLACDSCYRYAQDLAALERKRNSGDLKL